MPPRHVVLTVGGLAVLGAGLYLFVEVRAVEVRAVEVRAVEVRAVEVSAVEGRAARATADVSTRATGPEVKRPPKLVVRDSALSTSNNVGATIAHERATSPTPANVPQDANVDVQAAAAKLIANLTRDEVMAVANKALDRNELEVALEIAGNVLKDEPSNVWMGRVAVSAACKQGDATIAQKHYLPLPTSDREQMAERCSRYGITFTEPMEGSAAPTSP